MIQEFLKVRQDASGFKRYFADEDFDLFVWYDREGGEISGLQLVYDKQTNPRSMTWIKGKGMRHDGVDGEDSRGWLASPILVPDGVFDTARIVSLFLARSLELDRDIVQLVQDVLRAYDPRRDDRLV